MTQHPALESGAVSSSNAYNIHTVLLSHLPLVDFTVVIVTSQNFSAKICYLLNFIGNKNKSKETGRVTSKSSLSWNKTMRPVVTLLSCFLIVSDFRDSDTYTRQKSGSI